MTRVTKTLERDGVEFDVVIEGSYHYDAGRRSGPADLCYPAEESIDVGRITLAEGGAVWTGELTDEETREVEELLREQAGDDAREEEYAYADYLYDCRKDDELYGDD